MHCDLVLAFALLLLCTKLAARRLDRSSTVLVTVLAQQWRHARCRSAVHSLHLQRYTQRRL